MNSESELHLRRRLGFLKIKQGQQSKLTTCILFDDLFALMPASLMKDIDETMCTFQIDIREVIEQKLRPIKVLKSQQSPLSLLLFKNSWNILEIVQALQVEQERLVNISIHLFGHRIWSEMIENRQTYGKDIFQIKLEYIQRNQSVIYYNCYQNKNGFIGAAIRLDDRLTYIGIHEGGRFQLSYGILFTKDTINALISMLQSYTRPKIPHPDVYAAEQHVQFEALYKAFQEEYNLQIKDLGQIQQQVFMIVQDSLKENNFNYNVKQRFNVRKMQCPIFMEENLEISQESIIRQRQMPRFIRENSENSLKQYQQDSSLENVSYTIIIE